MNAFQHRDWSTIRSSGSRGDRAQMIWGNRVMGAVSGSSRTWDVGAHAPPRADHDRRAWRVRFTVAGADRLPLPETFSIPAEVAHGATMLGGSGADRHRHPCVRTSFPGDPLRRGYRPVRSRRKGGAGDGSVARPWGRDGGGARDRGSPGALHANERHVRILRGDRKNTARRDAMLTANLADRAAVDRLGLTSSARSERWISW